MSVLTSTQTSGLKSRQVLRQVVAAKTNAIVETGIPACPDSLPWSGFHTRVIAAAIIAWRYCFDAERKSLESVARPLAAQE